MRLQNTKGQGMSTNTIILLVLGLAVLIVLIMGFSIGWQKISPFVSSTNVDQIVTSCQAACSINSQFEFCTAPREVKDGVNDKFESTCADLATNPDFAERNYGIQECPAITCN